MPERCAPLLRGLTAGILSCALAACQSGGADLVTGLETPTAFSAPPPQQGSEQPAAEPVAEPVVRQGWPFGRRNRDAASAATPVLLDVTPDGPPAIGAVSDLPFGQVAKVCGVSPRKLGTEVARSQGSGKYRLYDSNPASTALRPQFITGFSDKCARQFSASLALFGSAQVHEATRYDPQNTNPYSQTDNAYEAVKSRVCGVRKGKNCPENRLGKLQASAAFVSVYRSFGDSGDWLEMFLNNGDVVASQTRSN